MPLKTYLLKAQEAQFADWRARAAEKGISLAHYLRSCAEAGLDARIVRVREEVPVVEVRKIPRRPRKDRKPRGQPVEPLPVEMRERAAQIAQEIVTSRCPRKRQHRKGVYCKTCGGIP